MTNLVLYFGIAAFITILAARYALPIFFKVVAIPGQIVQIVNGVLVAIIFVLSFVGLYYVFNDSVPVPPQPVADLTPIKEEKDKPIKKSSCSLTVNTNPTGAKVYVKGDYKGTSPISVNGLGPGRIFVKATMDDYHDKIDEIQIQQDEELTITLILIPVKPPLPCTSDAPVELVRSYYDDMSRKDDDSAVKKRVNPPSKLRGMVKNTDWTKVNDIKLESKDCVNATVSVNVTVKSLNGSPEIWAGSIDLQVVDGQWKILTMKNLKKQ
jgi:hypothetical protein